MKKKPESDLSAAQLEIMEIIWSRGELSAAEVREVLTKKREVARETVRTLLNRMEDKGWLKHRAVGRTYLYSALVPREASIAKRILDVVDTICGGSPERLVTALLNYRGLSDEEADRIHSMIDKSRKGKGRTPGKGKP